MSMYADRGEQFSVLSPQESVLVGKDWKILGPRKSGRVPKVHAKKRPQVIKVVCGRSGEIECASITVRREVSNGRGP